MSRNSQFNSRVPATAKCAICGTLKKETNHWYMVDFNSNHQALAAELSKEKLFTPEIAIFAYDQDYIDDSSGYPAVCGVGCLMHIISGNLDIIYPLKTESESLEIAEGSNE